MKDHFIDPPKETVGPQLHMVDGSIKGCLCHVRGHQQKGGRTKTPLIVLITSSGPRSLNIGHVIGIIGMNDVRVKQKTYFHLQSATTAEHHVLKSI